MKTFYHLVAILVLLALMAIPLTGCVKIIYETPASQETSAPSSQQASLSEATICKSVDSTTMQPIERADVFSPDFDIIYCSAKLSNAPPNTEVKAQWFDNNNQQLLEKAVTADGTRYVAFSIERATPASFTTGNYAVKLFLNGKEQVTVPFKIQAVTAGASLSEATMCKSVDAKTAKPIEKADVFAPNTPIIYCSVKLSNAPPNTEVKAQWIYKNTNTVLFEDVGMESGTYYLAFFLQPPKAGWAKGDYIVKLFLNGKETLSVPFKVQ